MKITIDKLICSQQLFNVDKSSSKKIAGGASVSGRSSSSVIFDKNIAFGDAKAAYFGDASGGASTRTTARAKDGFSSTVSVSISQTF